MKFPTWRRPKWRRLPYGKWTCSDGREVLFNRDYKPMWSRVPGNVPLPMNGDEHINFAAEIWFYMDNNPPWLDSVTLRRCEQALRDFGV